MEGRWGRGGVGMTGAKGGSGWDSLMAGINDLNQGHGVSKWQSQVLNLLSLVP